MQKVPQKTELSFLTFFFISTVLGIFFSSGEEVLPFLGSSILKAYFLYFTYWLKLQKVLQK